GRRRSQPAQGLCIPGHLPLPTDPHLTSVASSGPDETPAAHRGDLGPPATDHAEATREVPPVPRDGTVAYDSAEGPAPAATAVFEASAALPTDVQAVSAHHPGDAGGQGASVVRTHLDGAGQLCAARAFGVRLPQPRRAGVAAPGGRAVAA